MADLPPSKPPPNEHTKGGRGLKKLVEGNPNDDAFRLITQHGVPLPVAMQTCGATISEQAMKRRINRHNNLHDIREATATAALLDLSRDNLNLPDTPSHHIQTAAVTPGTGDKATVRGGSTKLPSKYTQAALDALPDWLSRDMTADAMTKRKKRKDKEMTRDNFARKAHKLHRNAKFKKVWKEATQEYHANLTGPTPRKKGFGARSVAKKYNELLGSPGDKKIGKQALANAVARGNETTKLRFVGSDQKTECFYQKTCRCQVQRRGFLR